VFRDILIFETESYYASKGEISNRQVRAINNAFNEVGITNNISNHSVFNVYMKDSPAVIKNNIAHPYSRDDIIVNHAAGMEQSVTINSEVPVNAIVTNSRGEIIIILPIHDEETFTIYPSADEQYIISIQAGSNFLSPRMQRNISMPPLLLAASMPGASFSASSSNLHASYSVTITPPGIGLISARSGDLVMEAVHHFNNSNAHAFLGLYRFDNVPLLNNMDFLQEMFGDELAEQLSRVHPAAITAGMQGFLVSYRAFNTTIKAIADRTNDPIYRADLMRSWSDNPDKTLMAMILFANEIDSGRLSREQLLRLDGVTLNVSVMGERQYNDRTRIGLRAFLSGSFSAEYEIVMTKQYFSAFGDVIPYDEIADDDILQWFVRFFSAEGEFLVIDAGDAIGIALRGQTAEDREDRRFRSMDSGWGAGSDNNNRDCGCLNTPITIAEGENLILPSCCYNITSAIEHGIARITLNMPFPHDDVTVTWDLPHMPMSVNLDREIPTQNLSGGMYTLNVWASHSTEHGTGQRIGSINFVVRPRIEITSFTTNGTSVTVKGNYFRVEEIRVYAERILNPDNPSYEGNVEPVWSAWELIADVDGQTFTKTISNLSSGAWYRLRVEAVLLPGQDSRWVSTNRIFVEFRPTWPVPSVGRNTVTSGFGNRIHPITGRLQHHDGIDIATPTIFGADIVAVASGRVTYSDWNGGYGNYIRIEHGDGITTHYAHCNTLLVPWGTQVTQGQRIATVGTTGSSTGPHLHFEVRKNGTPIDPIEYLNYTLAPTISKTPDPTIPTPIGLPRLTVPDAIKLAAHIYDGNKGEIVSGTRWELIDVYTPGGLFFGGLKMGVYRQEFNGQYEYVVANKGTIWYDIRNWGDNFTQPAGWSVDARLSISYARTVVQKYPNANITFIGHSKGGAEAILNGFATNRNVMAFNPARAFPNNSHQKARHCLTRAKMRGIEKVTEQCLLSACALNLKRLVKKLKSQGRVSATACFTELFYDIFGFWGKRQWSFA
jgi:hypothetical protein